MLKENRNLAAEILKNFEDRKEQISSLIAALYQLEAQLGVNSIDEEIDMAIEKAKQMLDEDGRRLKNEVKDLIVKNEEAIHTKIRKFSTMQEVLDELMKFSSKVADSSDAGLLADMPNFVENTRCYLEDELEIHFTYADPKFKSLIADSNPVALGRIASFDCTIKLNELEVDPKFRMADKKKEEVIPASKPNAEKEVGAMTQLFEQLPSFPPYSNPIDHLSMYTYDSPEPRTTDNNVTTTSSAIMNGHITEVNSSNTANPITWSQNFGPPGLAATSNIEVSNSSAAAAGSGAQGLGRPKTWSNLFQAETSQATAAAAIGSSKKSSPIHKSASNANMPKSIHYESGSRNTASPSPTADTALSAEEYVDPARVKTTQAYTWERDGVGSSIITVDVTSNGNVSVLDKESFSIYENGKNIFSSPRKFPAKAMAYITVDKVEFVVELHRDNVLRFHTRDGYKLPQVPPTYDTRRATQLNLCSTVNMLFFTFNADRNDTIFDLVPGEVDTDYIDVYDCNRIPPSPLNHFSTGVKGMRSMCALDTPKGIMVVLALANHCIKGPNQTYVILLALDINGKMLWQLTWNHFSEIQVVAGKVRYDLKAMCTDGRLIYVLDKLTGTVYAVCREGRKVQALFSTRTNNNTHMTINKRSKELILVNSEGKFTHYKLAY